MIKVIAMFSGGTLGNRFKDKPTWTALNVKITHGKSGSNYFVLRE